MTHSVLHVLWENYVSWALGSAGGGLLSILLISLSVWAVVKKQYDRASALAALELIPALLCCDSWRWALSVSGKADASLLGILSYPLLGAFCYGILAFGVICIAVSVHGFIARGSSPRPGTVPGLD